MELSLENGYTDRHILYIVIKGKITHAAFESRTRGKRGEACSPSASSNKIMETFVSMTDAQTILAKRIQFLPFA